MENVGMLVHRGLREVLGSLAEIGYDAEWQDIYSCQLGMPHQRERMFIIAYPAGVDVRYIYEKGWTPLKFGKCARGYFTDKRKVESAVLRNDDGLPGRLDRLRGLGNAIVPQIAELLFRQIIKNA